MSSTSKQFAGSQSPHDDRGTVADATVETKFNPWHDALGRFTFAPGSQRGGITIPLDPPQPYKPVPRTKPATPRSDDQGLTTGREVPPKIRDRVAAVARQFQLRTGRTLYITSGVRDSQSQAKAMYDKFEGGDKHTYRGSLGKEIRNVYLMAKRESILNDPKLENNDQKKAEIIIEKMKLAIDQQIKTGRFISAHLTGRAVDIRTRDMTADQKSLLKHLIAKQGGNILEEGIPPHTHVRFDK